MSLREDSLKWFFDLSEQEKEDLKEKYLPEVHVPFSDKWGYEYTLGQIEKMYKKNQDESKS